MPSSTIPGWIRAPLQARGGFVEYPPQEPHWPEVANRLLSQSLEHLNPVNSAATSEVYTFDPSDAPGRYYVKRFLDRDSLDPWKNVFRASRAKRAVKNDLQCQALGFGGAHPHCLIEQRRGLRLQDCVMISEAIEQAPLLRDWLMKPELGLAANRLAKQAFLKTLAIEVARWHEQGLHHGDLRAGNLLIRKASEENSAARHSQPPSPKASADKQPSTLEPAYQFFWLDNERTRKYTRLPIRNRIHNLSRLNLEPCGVDETDRLRFWKVYCEHSRMSEAEQETVLREVVAITLRRRKKRGWA